MLVTVVVVVIVIIISNTVYATAKFSEMLIPISACGICPIFSLKCVISIKHCF